MGMKDYEITVSRTACLKKNETWAPQTEFMAYFSALYCFDVLGLRFLFCAYLCNMTTLFCVKVP